MEDEYTGVDDVQEMNYVNSEESQYQMHNPDYTNDFNEGEPNEQPTSDNEGIFSNFI